MVARLTPRTAPIFATVISFCSYIRRAALTWSGDSAGGRPPLRPRARAAASPALVRSRIRSRSNSASAAKTWNTSRPPEEVVSIVSCKERNPTPCSDKICSWSIRCRIERPNRSSRHTTSVSPGATGPSASSARDGDPGSQRSCRRRPGNTPRQSAHRPAAQRPDQSSTHAHNPADAHGTDCSDTHPALEVSSHRIRH
jgi:hypothetical protein